MPRKLPPRTLKTCHRAQNLTKDFSIKPCKSEQSFLEGAISYRESAGVFLVSLFITTINCSLHRVACQKALPGHKLNAGPANNFRWALDSATGK